MSKLLEQRIAEKRKREKPGVLSDQRFAASRQFIEKLMAFGLSELDAIICEGFFALQTDKPSSEGLRLFKEYSDAQNRRS